MEQKAIIKIIIACLCGTLTVLLTMLAVLPFLNDLYSVEVSRQDSPEITKTPAFGKPEELLVTAVYEMEENSKKISSIYIEVFQVGSDTVTWLQIPTDTKVTLSESLYKSLQTYAPELPQYLKLSNMAEGFSTEYGLTGCNRILSEVLGVSISNYVRADKRHLTDWYESLSEEKRAKAFLDEYSEWLANSSANLPLEERWIYYESLQKVKVVITELAPGSREKDGYVLSGKRSKERLQELMIPVNAGKIEDN